MLIVQEDMERLFANEVRRMHAICCDYPLAQHSIALSYAHELQALWRRKEGIKFGDGGVASGEMLQAVRRALGREP